MYYSALGRAPLSLSTDSQNVASTRVMAKAWFIQQTGKVYGPYSSARLKELAAAGQISSDAHVSNFLDGPWHPISRVKGLKIPTTLASAAPLLVQTREIPSQSAGMVTTKQPRSGQFRSTESTVWSGRPSQITNIKTFILCGLFCWLVIPVFVAAWRWLVIQCMRYELTTQRFKVSHGVLSRCIDGLELYRVKDTSFSQSFFQRVFGIASIIMTTSDSSSSSVMIDSIAATQAKQLREQIRTLTEELRDRKRVREIDYT